MKGKLIPAAVLLLLALILSGCSGGLSSKGSEVKKPLEDLTLAPSELTLQVGETAKLSLTATPSDFDESIGKVDTEWNEDVISVETGDGISITAVGPGNTDLTVTVKSAVNSKISTVCHVTVVEAQQAGSGPVLSEGSVSLWEDGVWGIDVSNNQSNINWKAVKDAGCSFAILKCGEGANRKKNHKDSAFDQNVKACEYYGIPWGAYYFSWATTTDDAVYEAKTALAIIEQTGQSPDLPVFIDVEENRKADGTLYHGYSYYDLGKNLVTDISLTFCDYCSQKGYSAGIYSYTSFLKDLLSTDKWDATSYFTWVAEYGAKSGSYPGRYQIWQTSESYKLPSANVSQLDYNWYYPQSQNAGLSISGKEEHQEAAQVVGAEDSAQESGSEQEAAEEPGAEIAGQYQAVIGETEWSAVITDVDGDHATGRIAFANAQRTHELDDLSITLDGNVGSFDYVDSYMGLTGQGTITFEEDGCVITLTGDLNVTEYRLDRMD